MGSAQLHVPSQQLETRPSIPLARVNGFAAPISLALDAAPSGLWVSFTPNPATDTATLWLEVSADLEIGSPRG